MIKIENIDVCGFDAAIRGMRNPMNSWNKSDSYWASAEEARSLCLSENEFFVIGENDLKLMRSLFKAGSDHRKFMRFITVTCDITAPLYWWKEFDTYKVGTVANSCSTMHKIQEKEFTLDDFSHEHLTPRSDGVFEYIIEFLNLYRERFLEDKAKKYWWQMIQLIPSSYNQRRTVQMSYEVLANINRTGRRKDHKLDEWRDFCSWVDDLPYWKEITSE